MILTEEIEVAAQTLGMALSQDDFMRSFLDAFEEFQADPEARELEQQLYTIYNTLIARQQAGEKLGSEETQEFNKLRRRVQADPVIFKRDNELQMIKPYLANIADGISSGLGADYTALTREK